MKLFQVLSLFTILSSIFAAIPVAEAPVNQEVPAQSQTQDVPAKIEESSVVSSFEETAVVPAAVAPVKEKNKALEFIRMLQPYCHHLMMITSSVQMSLAMERNIDFLNTYPCPDFVHTGIHVLGSIIMGFFGLLLSMMYQPFASRHQIASVSLIVAFFSFILTGYFGLDVSNVEELVPFLTRSSEFVFYLPMIIAGIYLLSDKQNPFSALD